MTRQQEIKEEMQRVWCQHCKAMQKTNNTVVECLYNPLDHGRDKAFCASNEDAVNAILKAESDRGVVIRVAKELPNIINLALRNIRVVGFGVIGCGECHFANNPQDVNYSDPDEGYYDCSLLDKKHIWGEDPICDDKDWIKYIKDTLKAGYGAFESIIEKGGDDAKTEC